MNIIRDIEKEQMSEKEYDFEIGDTVRVMFKTYTGGRERVQPFEGVCISRKGSGVKETFTLRKYSHGVGVERTFPLHSPRIVDIEVRRKGDVRRAKLYYLRKRIGRSSIVKEKRTLRENKKPE